MTRMLADKKQLKKVKPFAAPRRLSTNEPCRYLDVWVDGVGIISSGIARDGGTILTDKNGMPRRNKKGDFIRVKPRPELDGSRPWLTGCSWYHSLKYATWTQLDDPKNDIWVIVSMLLPKRRIMQFAVQDKKFYATYNADLSDLDCYSMPRDGPCHFPIIKHPDAMTRGPWLSYKRKLCEGITTTEWAMIRKEIGIWLTDGYGIDWPNTLSSSWHVIKTPGYPNKTLCISSKE